MSMYNQVFGVHPLAGTLLAAMKLKHTDVPRIRDCYPAVDQDGSPIIVLFTRTGGGNRETYEKPRDPDYHGPYNEDLRNLAGFRRDEDDSYDSTYAYFFFDVPEEAMEIVTTLDLGHHRHYAMQKFKKMLDDMQSGNESEETKRAMSIGETILQKVSQSTGPISIVEV